MTALRRSVDTARDLLLLAVPSAGQLTARRNAWASMSENATRARAQREADTAMDRAVARAGLPASYGTQRLAR